MKTNLTGFLKSLSPCMSHLKTSKTTKAGQFHNTYEYTIALYCSSAGITIHLKASKSTVIRVLVLRHFHPLVFDRLSHLSGDDLGPGSNPNDLSPWTFRKPTALVSVPWEVQGVTLREVTPGNRSE